MEIRYVEPLRRAWARMQLTLLAPFDLGKWLVIAFSAWLAGLADGIGGGSPRVGFGQHGVGELRDAMEAARDWFASHPYLVPVILLAVVVAVAIAIVLLWVSSLGKFVFLDNVVHNRARIVEPWRRYRRLGHSLFLWRLGFAAVGAVVAAVLAALALLVAGGLSGFTLATTRGLVAIGVAVFLAVLFLAAMAVVALCLDSFVVPVMARLDLSAVAAWGVLWPWIERYLGAFVLYGLFLLVLAIGVGVVVVVVGLLTCCVGFVLLAIPYLGTVLLLPVLVTYRAFSLEFLAQFDPTFQLFSAAADPAPAA